MDSASVSDSEQEDDSRIHLTSSDDQSPLLLSDIEPCSGPNTKTLWGHRTKTYIAIACALVYFLETFSDYLVMAPRLRLLELAVCREFYQQNDPSKIDQHGFVKEALCKMTDIQAAAASYRSWQLCLNAVPALVLCIPLGRLSDQHGRKPYLILCICGWLLYQAWTHAVLYFYSTFPTSAFLTSSIFLFLGGGSPMLDALISAVITDVSSQDEISLRFNWMLGAFFCSEMLAPALSTSLVGFSLWAPFFLSMCTGIVGMALAISIPETLPSKGSKAIIREPSPAQPIHKDLKAAFSHIALPLALFLISPLRNIVIEIMIQFVSNRFRTSLGKAAYLASVVGVFSIAFYLGLLPLFRSLMKSKFHVSSLKMDYILSVFQLMASFVGALSMGLAPAIAAFVPAVLLYTSGSGIRATWLPVLIAHIEESRIATLCSIVSILETLGVIGGAFILETAAAKGFQFHDAAMGLPFYIAAILYSIGLVILAAFKMTLSEEQHERGHHG
ncbi:MFS general substrate transporter [Acephala macrosclerotiorum]|nr:MFS general substrate transporter [Acephala macrosclerotiorum]